MTDERKRFEVPKPVTAGDKIDVRIESQGAHGDGIAKIDGFTIFVKGGKKGERCRVKITDVKRTFATGEKVGSAKDDEAESEMEEGVEGYKDGPAG
ncbi:MAG: TRAM domain-containing protein [Candidatus Micrarchaeota archaeon]